MDRFAAALEFDSLESTRQEAAGPLAGGDRLGIAATHAREDDESREVLIHRPEPVVQEPMLGRPGMIEPVFMNVWAGSWLICSVTIEFTMAMSSAQVAMCGR